MSLVDNHRHRRLEEVAAGGAAAGRDTAADEGLPPQSSSRTRLATVADAEAITRIFNEGIEDRLAVFETELRQPEQILGWLRAGYPLVVCEDGDGRVVAWASAPPYGRRPAYAGVAVFSIYVARSHRRLGVGRATLSALIEEAEARGLWKLVSLVFPENEASLALCRSLGFREVGVYRRHASLDGVWRDVVIVECPLGEQA